MAELKGEEDLIKQGSQLFVTVEESLGDVLLVCLEHGAKIFRGALLDSSKRDTPFGICLPRLHADGDNKASGEQTEVLDMECESALKTEISALGYRHTYTLDPSAVDPKLLPPPKRDISRPLRDKNVRNMRLRPRRVLCSKCKKGIHENGAVRSEETLTENQNAPKLKRKHLPNVHSDSSKKAKGYHPPHLATVGPVIKISYATPRGEGAVVKIPPRPQVASLAKPHYSAEQADHTSCMNHAEYHKLRKAIKKEKLKKKWKATENDPDVGKKHGHHKKSKRGKHKVKRKHRHKGSDSKLDRYQEISQPDQEVSDDHAVPGGHPSFDEKPEIWEENNSEPAQLQEEYSITNTDTFSLKHKIKRNVLRQNDDSNSGYSVDSFQSSHQEYPSEDGLHSNDEVENYDPDSSSTPRGDATRFDSEASSLMMRIHTKNVTKCVVNDGRTVCTGDIVWGKILGFPWWPGRVITITVSQHDNGAVLSESAQVAWFGSSTMSHMPCSELYPYLEYYKLRYNKKKKGPYKVAVRQATVAAQGMRNNYTGEIQDDEIGNELNVLED